MPVKATREVVPQLAADCKNLVLSLQIPDKATERRCFFLGWIENVLQRSCMREILTFRLHSGDYCLPITPYLRNNIQYTQKYTLSLWKMQCRSNALAINSLCTSFNRKINSSLCATLAPFCMPFPPSQYQQRRKLAVIKTVHAWGSYSALSKLGALGSSLYYVRL